MTVDEMIAKYNISLHGTDQLAIPGGKRLPTEVLMKIKTAKPEILAELHRRKAEEEAAEAERKAREKALVVRVGPPEDQPKAVAAGKPPILEVPAEVDIAEEFRD